MILNNLMHLSLSPSLSVNLPSHLPFHFLPLALSLSPPPTILPLFYRSPICLGCAYSTPLHISPALMRRIWRGRAPLWRYQMGRLMVWTHVLELYMESQVSKPREAALSHKSADCIGMMLTDGTEELTVFAPSPNL